MNKNLPTKLFLIVLSLLGMATANTFAQQTKKISLQGFLKDANGKAVTDGSQEITFKLYTTAVGGTAAWTDTQTLNVTGGVYSTHLGSTANPLDGLSWGAATYYVGVTVQGIELSPRTELTFAPYSLGSPKAQEVVCSGAVGDVKYSILNPTQFAAVNGSCWVPMNGGSMAGSKLAAIIGGTTVPNAGGLFIRNQEFSNSSNHDPNRNSESPIATFQDQSMQAHTHTFSGNTAASEALPGFNDFLVFNDIFYGYPANRTPGSRTEAFEEGHGGEELYIKDKRFDLRGSHNHSFSGTTGNHNGTSAEETRPKNLNLWVYIRIN